MRLRLFAIACAFTAVSAAHAQQFAEGVQVTVIEVPVTVIDRNGNPVRNLTKDDFELYDDGRRVPVEYFDVVDMTRVKTGDDMLPPAATRRFVLMFDFANSSLGSIYRRAPEAAKNFINNQMGERDLAAIAVFSAENGAKMLTSFTSDRALLTAAVETLGHPKYFRIADPLMISATVVDVAGGGNRADDLAQSARAEHHNMVGSISQDEQGRHRFRAHVDNLAKLARALDRVPGQKQIILFSEGFDARAVQGRDVDDMGFYKSGQKEMDQVFHGEAYKIDNDLRFGSARSQRSALGMGDIFRRADVVLHAIDIKGLRVADGDPGASVDAPRTSNEGLYFLTNPTGGTVFKNDNDLTANMARLLEQQEVVYILGFTAKSGAEPGKFHELKVKSRAGRASHRLGYHEPTGKLTDLERVLTLAELMTTDAAANDVAVSLAATALPGPGGKARVPVVVEIPGPKLLERVGGDGVTANLYLYAFDGKQQVVDHLHQRISVNLAEAGDSVRKGGVRYVGTLRLPQGGYTVKALVRVDQSGRTGSTRSAISVPAFDAPTVMPPVALVEAGSWAMLVANPRGDEYAYPFAAGGTTYVPQAPATVQNGRDHTLALFLYRVELEGLQLDPLLVTAGGATTAADVKLLGRTAADDRGGVKLLFNFKPTGLPAGQHELRFKVKQKDGTESVVTLPIRAL